MSKKTERDRGSSPAELPGSQEKESYPARAVQSAGNPLSPSAHRLLHTCRSSDPQAGGQRTQVAAIGQAGPGG